MCETGHRGDRRGSGWRRRSHFAARSAPFAIYGLDESILACIDASNGELKWKGGRYGYGQVMLASGHLIVLTEQGELALVRADPKAHQEITRFPAIEGKTWNHPAMSDGILLIRNIEEMAAFNLRK